MTSKSEKAVNAKCREMYVDYTKMCQTINMTPKPYKQFKKEVIYRMIQTIAFDAASTFPSEDAGMTYYVTARAVGDRPPVAAEVRQCFSCQHDVWVDLTMVDFANRAKSIVCDVCAPELTGMSKAEMAAKALKNLRSNDVKS